MKRAPRKFLALALIVVAAAFVAGCTPQARKARHQAKADKYYDAGAFSQAEVEYLNVAKLDQNNAHAMGRLGLIYFEEGRIARAYQFLAKAKGLDPTDLPVRLRMGFLNLSLGNAKAAREEAMAVLEKNPKYPEAALLLAETGRTQKDAEAVRQRLDKLVQQTGITAESEIGYGALDYIATKFKEAELR